jgi:hypothetical protein
LTRLGIIRHTCAKRRADVWHIPGTDISGAPKLIGVPPVPSRGMCNELVIHVPAGSKVLPDNAAYTNRFEVKSETSDSIYVIAQSKKGRWWSCGCHGFLRWGHCKHLKAVGLPCGRVPFEARLAPKAA